MTAVIHLSFTDTGGAGKAALRLCLAQREAGMDARMLVAQKNGHSPAVEPFYPRSGLIPRIRREVRWRAMRQKGRMVEDAGSRTGYPFSPDGSPHRKDLVEVLARATTIHLHWVAHFLHLPLLNDTLLKGKCLVWTLHDFHPVTGGCHCPGKCDRFVSGCGHCPLLKGSDAEDLSFKGWQIRRKVFAALGDRLVFAAPSAWLAGKAEQSGVADGRRVHVLRNPLDLNCFRPHDPVQCRRLLGLPEDLSVVLFVSDRPHAHQKGGDLIAAVLGGIRKRTKVHFVSVGSEAAFVDIPDHTPLGMIADDRLLAMVYAAADVFLMPSRDDNMPNTVIESLACGTPVACFDSGGAPELIESGRNGAVVPVGDTVAMADAVVKLLNDAAAKDIRHQCRQTAENEVAPERIVNQCRSLYLHTS